MSMSLFSDPILVNATPIGAATVSPAQFGYEAIEDKKRRKPPTAVTQSEDRELNQSKRRKLIGTNHDLMRNYALVGWMVRRHLDYVTQFRFQCTSDDHDFNDEVERRMKVRSRRANLDVRGAFTLNKYIRISELCSVRDGDLGSLYLRSGHLQGIESDRIRTPTTAYGNSAEWMNGVRINKAGRPLEYSLHRRIRGGQAFEFERSVKAKDFFLHAKVERFDQVRGVSPIASAMNDLTDLKENKTYALLKQKVAQFFGLITTRDSDDSTGEITNDGTDGDEKNAFEVDFGNGPFHLDLGTGEDAKFLTADTPGTSFKEFHELVMMIALKCLDIPYSFFDEGHTNFFGSRGSWLLYNRSCVAKREDVQELLNWISIRDLTRWILDPVDPLVLPAGMTIGSLPFEWVPVGMPWWDKGKEVTGDLKSIGGGLSNPYRVCKETDSDFETNIDKIAEALKYAEDRGNAVLGRPIQLTFDPGPDPVEVEVNAND
jgi:capsid protein